MESRRGVEPRWCRVAAGRPPSRACDSSLSGSRGGTRTRTHVINSHAACRLRTLEWSGGSGRTRTDASPLMRRQLCALSYGSELEPAARFELATCRLQSGCSTAELRRRSGSGRGSRTRSSPGSEPGVLPVERSRREVEGAPGVEPGSAASKAAVLPIGHMPLRWSGRRASNPILELGRLVLCP